MTMTLTLILVPWIVCVAGMPFLLHPDSFFNVFSLILVISSYLVLDSTKINAFPQTTATYKKLLDKSPNFSSTSHSIHVDTAGVLLSCLRVIFS
jgi:hypothetical protein